MCWFVVVAFPPAARAAPRGLLRSALHMRELENPSVLGSIPDGWYAASLSDGTCGCDMDLDPGLRLDVRRAISELAAAAGPVRTLVHAFRGSVDTERITADPMEVTAAAFLREEALVRPDVWYALSP